MGGTGSGRQWYPGAKDTVDDYLALDVRHLRREGLLSPWQSFDLKWSRGREVVASIRICTESEHLMLSYRQYHGGNGWKPVSYSVRLAWTPCHLGGRRPWFLCPAQGCARRVAILYGGAIFACRDCHRLSYSSQRESEGDRAIRRADSIRSQLGWAPGILNGHGGKPKGMHWQTFERLRTEHDRSIQISVDEFTSRVSRPDSQV